MKGVPLGPRILRRPLMVHILHYGAPLCRFTPHMPCDWPKGHKWISLYDDGKDCTCPGCKKEAPRARDSQAKWSAFRTSSA